MKAIVVMFDTLSRRYLPCYGNDWVKAPNFDRLAAKAVTFDTSYVCSMPCMPARRDYHTGRPNFLHRSWGPLEPFDDSMPRMLSRAGVHTHMCTDHNHYFEDGGLNYHTQFTTWEYFRGQEGDPWKGELPEPPIPERVSGKNAIYSDDAQMAVYRKAFPEVSDAGMERLRFLARQDWANRKHMPTEETQSQTLTFDAGLEFITTNAAHDNWMVHIETFDPHEPFYSPEHYKALYPQHYTSYDGPVFDWPYYGRTTGLEVEAEHLRHEYAALISMCDRNLGRVLDAMDAHDLWTDTMLIVWTDHGFLMGEHDWWGKCSMPMYQEIAHTPFFIWDPRSGAAGERRGALVQPSIDLAPTLLRFFGHEPTARMLGKDLAPVVARDDAARDAGIFGMHGAHVNVTDGRHVYMRAPANAANEPLFQYTLMPTHMRSFFDIGDFKDLQVAPPFAFTRGASTMKIGSQTWRCRDHAFDNLLWDVAAAPDQAEPLRDTNTEARLIGRMTALMAECEAPQDQYERLGLPPPHRGPEPTTTTSRAPGHGANREGHKKRELDEMAGKSRRPTPIRSSIARPKTIPARSSRSGARPTARAWPRRTR